MTNPMFIDKVHRIVRLQNNYRSHPEIVRFSNEKFYNNTMETKVAAYDKNYAIGWNILPNRKIPLIFHDIKSTCAEDKKSKSLYNPEECNQVVNYIRYLVTKVAQEDIGVASPYTAQVNRLKSALTKYQGIHFGTTEFFQGREKPIMIISTVISSARDSNFLSESRVRNRF